MSDTDKTAFASAKAPEAESSTSSDPGYDLEESWPKEVKIPQSRATAEWQTGRQENLWFDLTWDKLSARAFFKLRTSIQIDAPPGISRANKTSKKKTSIYLFIYPERVRRLSVENHTETDTPSSADSLVLRWELAKQPALILPPSSECEPGNNTSRSTLAAMHVLAAQNTFTIHVTVKGRRQSMRRMQELCKSASNCGLTSLAGQQDTASLYQGRGGRVVEGSSLVGNPPLYAHAQLAPPGYEEPLASGKASETGSYLTGRASPAKKRRHEASMSPVGDESLRALIDAAIEEKLDARLQAVKSEVADLIQQAEERTVQKVVKELEQHIDAAVETKMVNVVDDRISEFVEKRVREEMDDVESSIMRNIAENPLEARISFPNHPWY